MIQRRLALIIGAVLSLVAVFLIKIYIDQTRMEYRKRAQQAIESERANSIPVLIAKEDLPKGTVIEQNVLEIAIYPKQYVQPNAVTSLDRIDGMILAAPIAKGEQITVTKLISSQQATGGSLAMITPPGKRAVTIPVDNISSVGGMIMPGDKVDVIGMVPTGRGMAGGKEITQVSMMPLFQNVLVLSVGQDLGGIPQQRGSRYKKEEAKPAAPIVTLALSPQEANLIAFVQEQGKIRLLLRSPADEQISTVAPANWDTLLMYLTPDEYLKQLEPIKKEPPGRTVEIYRGAEKEVVPLVK